MKTYTKNEVNNIARGGQQIRLEKQKIELLWEEAILAYHKIKAITLRESNSN